MTEDFLDYGRLIDEAMHHIVKRTLELVEEHGLPGDHHFYITFLTEFPGVMVSDELKDKYPDEMTIVLQHQYWDLEIEEERFSVVLSFNNVKHNLTVPFASITSFADPSVKFGLQFRQAYEDYAEEYGGELPYDDQPQLEDGSGGGKSGKGKPSNSNNVVSLDNFRNK